MFREVLMRMHSKCTLVLCDKVGHGQLYVALSCVGAAEDVSVFINKPQDDTKEKPYHCMNTSEGTFMKNIVFREVFE